MTDRWKKVRPVLQTFQTALADKAPELTIVQASDRHWNDEEYKARRPKGFPSRSRGVYLLFDDAGDLLYVGLAMYSFDKRVWAHDQQLCGKRRWIDIVPFPSEWLFLAPALEFLLITKLKPPSNKVYRDY